MAGGVDISKTWGISGEHEVNMVAGTKFFVRKIKQVPGRPARVFLEEVD